MNATLKYLLVSLGILGLSTLVLAADPPDLPWDSGHEANPQDGDAVSMGDNWMRRRATSIRARMGVEHQFGSGFNHAMSMSADTEDNGLHRLGSARCFISNTAPNQLGGFEYQTCSGTSPPCISDITGSNDTASASALDADETGGVKCSATDGFGGAGCGDPGDAVRKIGEGRCWIDVDGPDDSTGVFGGDTLDDYTLWVHNGTNWATPGTTFTSTGLVTGATQSQMVYEPGKTATVGSGGGAGVDLGTEQITFASAHGFINGDGPVTVTGSPSSCGVEFGGDLLTDADTNDLWIGRISDTIITLHADKEEAVAGTPDLDLDDATGIANCVFTIGGKTVVRGGTFDDQHDGPSGTAGEVYIKDSDGSLNYRNITGGVLGVERPVMFSEGVSGNGDFFQWSFDMPMENVDMTAEHGLGSIPRLVSGYALCTGDDTSSPAACGSTNGTSTGYSAGDVLYLLSTGCNEDDNCHQLYANATNISFGTGDNLFILTNGSPHNEDRDILSDGATDWDIHIFAWK